MFLPATRLDRFAKAIASGADAVILDLEDGVDPGARAEARTALGELAASNYGAVDTPVYVRVNAQRSPDGIFDMAAILSFDHWPMGFMLPKIESVVEVLQIKALADARSKTITLVPVIETPLGLARVEEIAATCGRIGGIGFGAVDYTSETTGSMDREALLAPRARIVNAAAIASAPAIDCPWLDLDDLDGLDADCRHGRSLGFGGKIAIHPKHIATINRAFSPTAAEAEWATRVLEASEKAGIGAFSFEGRMIDAPVLARARRLIEQADRN